MTVSFTRESALCQDGLENETDGLIDFDGGASRNGGVPITAPDPQCVAYPWRNQETPPPTCGLGAELVMVLPLLGLAASRRRREG